MKCPICGKQTLPGAKLCSPCRAALKRAKDDSVWELPPSQRPGEPRGTEPPAAREPQWVLGAPRLGGWRAWAVGVAAVAVCAGVGVLYARGGESPAAAPLAVSTPPARAIVAEPPANALQRAIPASTQPASPASEAAPDEGVVQPPRHVDHPPPARPKTARPAPEPVATPVTPALDPAPVEVPRQPAVQPEPPPRPVDPLQRMNDALARCRAQDLFGRLGCEYRARATYCEGHWGESAQCPGAPSNDHGQ